MEYDLNREEVEAAILEYVARKTKVAEGNLRFMRFQFLDREKKPGTRTNLHVIVQIEDGEPEQF